MKDNDIYITDSMDSTKEDLNNNAKTKNVDTNNSFTSEMDKWTYTVNKKKYII